MPPKAKGDKGPSKKTEAKAKEKVIEDKTFGLKNKKGNKQQKFIKMVQVQVQHGGTSKAKVAQQPDKAKVKDEKKKLQDELNLLFKPVEQKVPKGVDPKSVVCAHHKLGLCKKGDKCKFSHDLTMGRKAEKRSVYDDAAADKDNMDDWDEEKLEEVVNQKHGESNKSLPATSIICKFFLEAVENSKYGWFWQCPNGKSCHYRHALPQGFILKKDQKKSDSGPMISLEELIEKERASMNSTNLTRVTLESFLIWKEKKRKEKIAKLALDSDKKKADYRAGKLFGVSGREMFEFNPDLVEGDDDEADDVVYSREDSDEEDDEKTDIKELTLESLAANAREVDPNAAARATSTSKAPDRSHNPADLEDDSNKLSEAAALPSSSAVAADEAISLAMAATVNGGVLEDDLEAFDENLFDGEDLDLVEEELETLELND